MSLKPWREIARPHKDVLEGTFKQSEFAADISQVAAGSAPPEYQDAEKFFSRTCITEGMRLLLISVAQRVAGEHAGGARAPGSRRGGKRSLLGLLQAIAHQLTEESGQRNGKSDRGQNESRNRAEAAGGR